MNPLLKVRHQSAVREAVARFGVSSFVVRCLLELAPAPPSAILDVPCGFGRHTLWLAAQGHGVTAIDIDPERVAQVQAALKTSSHERRTLVADASDPLPLESQAFDGAIIVDYFERKLLGQIGRLVRPGGFLVYETFSARGSNWRQLPRKGETELLLHPDFEMMWQQSRPTGPAGDERETFKLLARRTA